MIKALVIAPYQGMVELLREVSQEVQGFDIHVELGNLQTGVEIATRAERQGIDVIISRGGTASMIQSAVHIPVIDIQVSGYDVLRILTLVKSFSGKAAIVGFPNISQGAATICKLLDFDIETVTIHHDQDVTEKLLALKEENVEVVIGDVVTVEHAKKLGMTGVLITSGREALISAFDEAKRVYKVFQSLSKDVALYRSILEFDERAIAIINQQGELVYRNKAFNDRIGENVTPLNEMKEVVHRTIASHHAQDALLFIEGELWNVTSRLDGENVLLYLEHYTPALGDNLQRYEQAIDVHQSLPPIVLSGKSVAIDTVHELVKEHAEHSESIWISGEPGVGKQVIAQQIYLLSKRQPFVIIRGKQMSNELFRALVSQAFLAQYKDAVVFLKDIDHLDLAVQRNFYEYIRSQKNRGSTKWIVSTNGDIEDQIKKDLFLEELYRELGTICINVPPLRNRSEDIEHLVQFFISDSYATFGNEVVGVRKDALDLLVSYEWPGNVRQLKKVTEQLMAQCRGYYIEKEDVESALRSQHSYIQKDFGHHIKIDGTLEEIEKEIISKVLEEENFNQSKAAKRLGINRSTLWRKLK
ncbi:sigma-54-dependent Fis family transcriptional regulator [Priestia koreensis]|uniref:sigma-54-dependent Fis family transcriptional regulator n=1 Tax=Priestia koreensis TaxID=284581 RepID=UPI001F56C674|nr:sigma-54-dependent transcriptional regulator [Priestia koreensis]UNL86464.1 sigma-54-dependent Fis family transcriptional regulator [Priestia koreensis]